MGISTVLFFLFLVCGLEGINIQKTLREIPQEDRQNIKALFVTIFRVDHGVYTLFGDKPISLSGDFEITPWENTIEGMQCGGIFWKRWAIWEEYKHLFPLKNYLLIKEPSKSKIFKKSEIIFINKIEFLNILKKNLLIFENVLERKINPEKMLKDIEEKKISFADSINNNQMLWGILLGYGVYNASLYNKRERVYYNNFDTSDAALRYSTIKLEGFGEHSYSPLTIGSVHFVADLTHSETKFLQDKYKELRGKISAIYAKGDFLEITLSQLTSN